MANLLYKLGIFSARRAWIVIVSWFLILAASVGLMVNFAGKLSTSMSLPGTPSQLVIDDLNTSFPKASNGNAQVLLHKTNGFAFNAEDKKQILAVLKEVEALEIVGIAQDPFATEASLKKNRMKVSDGQAALDAAPAELKAAQAKIDAGQAKLEKSQAELTAGQTKLTAAKADLDGKLAQLNGAIEQLKAANAPASQIDPLLANLAQLNAGLAEIAKQQAAIDAGQAKIDAGAADLAAGQQKVDDGYAAIESNKAKIAASQLIMTAMKNFHTVSKDGQTATVIVMFNKPFGEIEEAELESVVAIFEANPIENVQVEYSQELTKAMPTLGGPAEVAGLIMAAIVLFVMLGTLVGAGLPVLAAILGVGISATATMALSSVIDMTATTPMLGAMLGLAVGIDYSLFILNRHRRQLKAGMDVRESIGLANGTSGNAVVFAGLTVIIALVALNLTGVGFLGLMGNAAAVSIVVAVLVAVTFTPALLGLLGTRLLSKRERNKLALAAEGEAPVMKDPTRPVFATKRPWLAIAAVVLIMGVAAQPLASMRLGLPDGSSEPVTSTQYKSFKLAEKAFGAGVNGPLVAVASADRQINGLERLEFQAGVATRMMELPNVSSVIAAAVSNDKTKFLFQVIPVDGPASETTEKLVFALRGLSDEFKQKYGVDLGVTGAAAANIDISKKLADALPLYLGAVLLLSLFLLILVFRSILVPLIASAGFLLTVVATLGSAVAVFQWGWMGEVFDIHDPGPIMSFVPTLIIGVVFGLAMDYQLFLGSGMREAFVHGKSAKEAVNFGIHLSRPVVIAAAIIMVTVFGGFAFSEMTTIRPIGFGLAVGVLFDAFLVRLILVPALMTLVGDKAWWLPKWLDRILPDVDVEGAALERKAEH